jgi:hypothetical protein
MTTLSVVQATLVLGLTAFVGSPQFREPARAVTVWRTGGPLTPRPELVAMDSRLAYDTDQPGRRGSDGRPGTTRAVARTGQADSSQNVGFTGDRAFGGAPAGGGRAATINGRARTALNQPVPYARVLLRNLATGQIESRTTADQNGQFSFDGVISSGYVVELVGADGAVIAASEMVAASGGSIQQATVRLGGNSTARALFGSVGATASGTSTSTTTTTTTTIGDGGASFIGGTASEPIGRAAEAGAVQTLDPSTAASARN